MGSSETNSPTASQSPSGKRSRDPEDEVYIDNLNSHKRYLSEMMASSLNCLSVGDPIPDNVLDSPARSESMFYSRDDMALQYSPMSEDLDDARYYETPMSACSSQSESRPTSPVSPYRYKPVGAFCSSPPSTSLSSSGCNAFSGTSQSRQRGSDTEGRFPSSPSDICHSSDLRKAALLRSVQMRTQPSCSSAYDLSFTAMQNAETETRSSSFLKPLDGEREYHDEECPVMPLSELGFDQGKSMELNMSEFNQGKDSMGMNMVEFNQGKGSMGLDMIEFDQGKNPLGLNMVEYDQGKNSMGFGHGEFHQGKDSMGLTMGEYDQGKGSMGLNMDNFDQGKDPMVLNMNDSDQGKNSMGLNMGEYDRGKVPMGLNMDNFDQGKDPMVLNMNDSDQGKNSMRLNMGEFDQGKDSMGLTIGELDREKDSMGLNMGEAERSAN